MRRPLMRAVFVADLEVLGRLTKSFDWALERRQETCLADYLRHSRSTA